MKDLQKLVAQYKKQIRNAEDQLFSATWHGWVLCKNFTHPMAEVIKNTPDYTNVVLSPDISEVELFKLMVEAANGSKFDLCYYKYNVNHNSFKFTADLTARNNRIVKFRGKHKELINIRDFKRISNVEVLIEDI